MKEFMCGWVLGLIIAQIVNGVWYVMSMRDLDDLDE